MKYATLYERLVSNIHEPLNDQSCWAWKRRVDREGYGIVNVYVPGLKRTATLKAHIVMWLLTEFPDLTADELYLAYQEHSASGMEIDHGCVTPCCINRDHLEHCGAHVNQQRRAERARKRAV